MNDEYLYSMQPHDYPDYLLNQGDNTDSATTETYWKSPGPREQISVSFKIALIAETQAEAQRLADQLLERLKAYTPESANCFSRHSFSAHGLDQPWPEQQFDELHFLCSSPDQPLPASHLDRLAGIINIHHLAPCMAQAHPGYRSYLWCTEKDLCDFWASLYLAREMRSIPGLKWDRYPKWQLPEHCIGQAATSWGSTPIAAIDSLIAQAGYTKLTTALDALLVIEGNYDFTLGDYVDILDRLETRIKCDVVPTGWLNPTYSGYGLKLLTFDPIKDQS